MANWNSRLRLAAVKFPCYGCEERHENCHASCEKYKEAQAKNKEIQLARIKHTKGNAYFKDRYAKMYDKPVLGKKHYL